MRRVQTFWSKWQHVAATGKAKASAYLPQLGWALYGLSLVLPALRSLEPHEHITRIPGIVLLCLGWFGIAAPLPGMAWLANPLLLIAATLRTRKPRLAVKMALVSMVVSWVSFWAVMVFDLGAICWIVSFPCIAYGWWHKVELIKKGH